MSTEIFIQEPTPTSEVTVDTNGAVIYNDGTETTAETYQETRQNPHVRENIEATDVLFIGGIAVFGIVGSYLHSRSSSRVDS